MDEPRRLLEESESHLEHALLRAGTSYRSSERTRVRTLISLGLAGSATIAASGASASLLAKSGWVKLFVLSALAGVASVPVISSVMDSAPAERVAVVAPPVRTSTAKAASLDPVAVEAPAVATAPALAPRVARAVAPRNGTRGPALASELAALDAARSALSAGEARRALSLLDGYARAYPRGRMQVEAEVLRIDALARAGQKEGARKRAEAFLRRQPNSVLASRVRTYL